MNSLAIIVGLIPALIKAILAIEAAIPEGGKGADKLEAIRETLEIADANVVPLMPKILGVVGVFVKLFNKTSTFKSA